MDSIIFLEGCPTRCEDRGLNILNSGEDEEKVMYSGKEDTQPFSGSFLLQSKSVS